MALYLISRILIAALFIITGINSLFFNLEGFTKAVESKGFPFPRAVAIIAAVLKIVAGLMIVLDNYYADPFIIWQIVFVAWATYLFHNVFIDRLQLNAFSKNLTVMGGLLLLLDHRRNSRVGLLANY